MKKEISIVLMISLIMLTLAGCATTSAAEGTLFFRGTVSSIDNLNAIVTPDNNEEITKSGDAVAIYFSNKADAEKFNKGDKITVEYEGEIMESYPLQINVISIEKEGLRIKFERKTISDSSNNNTISISSAGKEVIIPSQNNKNQNCSNDNIDIGNSKDDNVEGNTKPEIKSDNVFTGKIQEILEGGYIVVPDEGQSILRSGDKIAIYTDERFTTDDKIKVTYNSVMESYPLQVEVLRLEKTQ